MDFEWDDSKAESNEAKHGVTFAAASRRERKDYEDGNFP